MNQSNSSKQVLLSVIGVAILVVAVVGVSFAFFNYTRTGAANEVRTGTILFSTDQTQITVSNFFPIARSGAASATEYVGTSTVTINGSTTYTDGVDYRVTLTPTNLSTSATGTDPATGAAATAKTVPVSVVVTANTALGDGTATTGNINRYQLTSYEGNNALRVVNTGSVIATGHIGGGTSAAGVTNGVITIKTYLDKDLIAITDTLAGENDSTTNNGLGYTNGTTGLGENTWVNGRQRLTTADWNSLATNPLTFTVKVEAIETGGRYVGE